MKILFIGLGAIGQRHLRNIDSLIGSTSHYIAYRARNLPQTITPDLKIDPHADFIKQYGVQVFTDLDEAIAQQPDVAFVCNPSSLHIPTCLSLARAGIDFFVEKPLSHSLEGVSELIQLCEEKKLINMVGFQLRFHPAYIAFKELLSHRTIFAVHAEVGEYLPDWHKYEDYRQSYAARKDLGGGVVLTQIHEIDYLIDLFYLPSKVMAMGGQLSTLQINTEDSVDILMDMGFPVSLHMDFLQRPPVRYCEVFTNTGKIGMDLLKGTVNGHDFSYITRNQVFLHEVEYFLNCIKQRVQPIVTVKDGLKSLQVALKIKEQINV